MHRIYMPTICPDADGRLLIEGPEAHHAAAVKRIRRGEQVCVFDGSGRSCTGLVEQTTGSLIVRIETDRTEPLPDVHLIVRSAVPKGDRAEAMVDSLSQVGAAAFSPLRTARSVVTPRQAKIDRWRRIAIESAKQSGRSYLMDILPGVDVGDALADTEGEQAVLDATGESYAATGALRITLYVGPEGGWSDEERVAFQQAGVAVVSLGVHTLRIETAAVVGAALILSAERHV
ncbi:MAG: 16S rRNA (uracil(1498)-N(3))-methyltransferase [Phycisphaerales bacterium]|nr:16S rRNA (uracil(1498)-N(3))-methyltransferase [Phycisphaerales bacterium]